MKDIENNKAYLFKKDVYQGRFKPEDLLEIPGFPKEIFDEMQIIYGINDGYIYLAFGPFTLCIMRIWVLYLHNSKLYEYGTGQFIDTQSMKWDPKEITFESLIDRKEYPGISVSYDIDLQIIKHP